ncbi:MAG: Extracellular exo-alpha-L-arabinofuranosidase [Luteibacter sp.]|uniref:RICIN domain-containing protein n=1 Tax=Luteibacter sp. TaxID=1886636 RepID=UPI00137F0512|nr:ricin-type beta-trefoil lectin domain protein [Luteibacter sp.]KAF1003456.1 MAG: Extracellular exo-alpha-L-arabinofuranosidase [Luteibacter sp.]
MKYILLGLLALAGLSGTSGARAQVAPSTAIVSSLTNQCWDVVDYSKDDGAIIQLYPCTGTSNQSWAFQVYAFNAEAPMARIVNVNSGMCAAVESSNPASGAIGLRQHPCNTNDPLQQFTIEAPLRSVTFGTNTFPIPLVARHIVSVATHWCMKADATFYRPFEASGCGETGDQSTRWRMVGI